MYAIKSVLLGVSALAAFVAAQSQLYFTQTPPQAVPGTTYQIKYHAPSGAVSRSTSMSVTRARVLILNVCATACHHQPQEWSIWQPQHRRHPNK